MISGMIVMALVTILVVFLATKLVPFFVTRWTWRRQLDPHFAHWPISWITGSIAQFRSYDEFIAKSKKFVDDGHKVYLWWLGPFRCAIVAAHPDAVKVLLRSSEPKTRFGCDILRPWLGDGLLTAEGEKWARNRRLLTPAFHFEILRDYVQVYNSVVEIFMDKMEKASGGERYVETSEPLAVTTLDALLRCALSYDDGIQLKGYDHPYAKAVRRLVVLIIQRALKFHLYPDFVYKLSAEGREFYKLCDFVHNFTMDIITSRKKKLEQLTEAEQKTTKGHLDFLDILLTSKDEEGRGLTDAEIRDEVDTFTFAGHETTSTVLGWCLYALGRYQDIQERVFNDVKRVMGDRIQVEWEDLGNFQYLPLFIRETMRVYTPVPAVSRDIMSPMTVEGVDIPKGVAMEVNILHVHNNIHLWDKPTEFIPERFEKEAFAGKDPYLFVPFSAGPRNCIGQNFAMNELKTMVARIVNRFRIEADPDIDPEPFAEVTLRAKNGIHLKFTRR